MAMASKPWARISLATCSQASALRLEITTRAPQRAISSAMARPMPLVEPVITATFPVISNNGLVISESLSLWVTAVSAILTQFKVGDGIQVNLIRAVCQAQGTDFRPGRRQEGVLADASTTVHLYCAVDDLQSHARGDHLDHGNFLTGHFVAYGIHHMGSLKGHQASLLDVDATTGNVFPDGIKFGQRATKGLTGIRALAHKLKGPLGDTDGAHAMVDTARPEAPLGDFKAATFTQQDITDRYTHVVVVNLGVAVRRMVITEYRQRANHFHPGCIQRHQNHRLLLVLGSGGVGFTHNDGNLAGGGHGTRRPPLTTVNNVLVTFPTNLASNVGCVRGSHIRLCHGKAGSDFSIQKRLQPLLLLFLVSVTGNGLHVAGVRRGAVEYLGSHLGTAHNLAQMCVLEVCQAGPQVTFWQEQVPQPGSLRFFFQLFNDRNRCPTVLRGCHLMVMLFFIRVDIGIHELG